MMKVRKIGIACPAAQNVPSALDAATVEWHSVGCCNWEEQYPSKPSVQFRLAHIGSHLLLHFSVDEECTMAACTADDQQVWTDSCVEFFLSPKPGDGTYYNLECNCTGHLLLGGGGMRPNRGRASEEVTHAIGRWASLGSAPFAERHIEGGWQVALVVPASAYFLHQIESFDGLDCAANFYKCGDNLSQPHFLSWQPINTPTPNFHRPEAFGTLHFE